MIGKKATASFSNFNLGFLFLCLVLATSHCVFGADFVTEPNYITLEVIEGTLDPQTITIISNDPQILNLSFFAAFPDQNSPSVHTEMVSEQYISPQSLANRTVQPQIDQSSINIAAAYDPDLSINKTMHPRTRKHKTSYKSGRILVRFAPQVLRDKKAFKNRHNILNKRPKFKKQFRSIPGLELIELPENTTVEDALKLYNNSSDVLYAQPDYILTANEDEDANDTYYNNQWALQNNGYNGEKLDADIDAPLAWQMIQNTTPREIIVAVIDSGVQYDHPDLQQNMWTNPYEIPANGVDDDFNGYVDDIYGYDFANNDPDPYDDHYHGTHCAGIIAAITNNQLGVASVAGPQNRIKIMALKFLDSEGNGYTSNAIDALQYSIDNGAIVSNNSYGSYEFNQAFEDALDAAYQQGVIFAAAAGNDTIDNDSNPHYPSSYDSPAVIAVMSTDSNDDTSYFSNFGSSSVDIAAPGSSIFSCNLNSGYRYASGTSMATPYVAGAAALLLTANSQIDSDFIKQILLDTVDIIVPGLCVSGGRLNLANAISKVPLPWTILDQSSAIIDPAQTFDLQFDMDASNLKPGMYEGLIIISSDEPNDSNSIPLNLIVHPDALQITQQNDIWITGQKGGHFNQSLSSYRVTNNSLDSVNFTINTEQLPDWISVEPNQAIISPLQFVDLAVSLSANAYSLEPGQYNFTIKFENLDSNSIKYRNVNLKIHPQDFFTEQFTVTPDSLEMTSITFTPNGNGSYYAACKQNISQLPYDTVDAIEINLGDDDYYQVTLANDANILFYGNHYNSIYISSNGYLTFDQGDTTYFDTLQNHFTIPRLSILFNDLRPNQNTQISYEQTTEKFIVTYIDIPEYSLFPSLYNTFQIEFSLTKDRSITVSWLEIQATAAIAGLSKGEGLSLFYQDSDFQNYRTCTITPDINQNYIVNFNDFAILAQNWLDDSCNLPFWCGNADIDFSGSVDQNDIEVFSQYWLDTQE